MLTLGAPISTLHTEFKSKGTGHNKKPQSQQITGARGVLQLLPHTRTSITRYLTVPRSGTRVVIPITFFGYLRTGATNDKTLYNHHTHPCKQNAPNLQMHKHGSMHQQHTTTPLSRIETEFAVIQEIEPGIRACTTPPGPTLAPTPTTDHILLTPPTTYRSSHTNPPYPIITMQNARPYSTGSIPKATYPRNTHHYTPTFPNHTIRTLHLDGDTNDHKQNTAHTKPTQYPTPKPHLSQ